MAKKVFRTNTKTGGVFVTSSARVRDSLSDIETARMKEIPPETLADQREARRLGASARVVSLSWEEFKERVQPRGFRTMEASPEHFGRQNYVIEHKDDPDYPLIVVRPGYLGGLDIVDGNHRWEVINARENDGKKRIRVLLVDGDPFALDQFEEYIQQKNRRIHNNPTMITYRR